MPNTIASIARKTELADARVTDVKLRTASAVVAMNAYNSQMVVLRTTIDGPTSWSSSPPVSGPVTLLEPRVVASSKVFITVLNPECGLRADAVRYDITAGEKVVFTVSSPVRTSSPIIPRINVVIYLPVP